MACSHGRVDPSNVTKMRLFADSGGFCQNPKCLEPLFKDFADESIHIAEIAHVISAGDAGPRAHPEMPDAARAHYENLILLCPNCHTTIDKAPESFPEGMVFDWKETHRKKIDEVFGIRQYSSREEARKVIEPLFRENGFAFEKYGPHREEAIFNPESNLPGKWRHVIRAQIVPNNRKILSILEANSPLLSAAELQTLDEYRQHVFDFEAKHIEGVEENGMQFPPEAKNFFWSPE